MSDPTAPSPHPYARLTPDCVLDAVEALGLHCNGRIFALNSYENRVYQIGMEEGPNLIAKFYRPGRWSEAQIREELDFVTELAALEIPALPPWQDEHGEVLFRWGEFMYTLTPQQGGQAPILEDFDTLEVLGRLMGRIHAAGEQRDFQFRPTLSVADYAEASAELLLGRGFIPDSLVPAYESLSRELIDILKARYHDVNTIRLHGDCHPGNVLWRHGSGHFVDFDDARMGPAVQDLWMLLSGERAERLAQLDALIEGYQQFRDFDPRELRLIEPLRTLRLMHYSAWLARRWEDPAFPATFTWFNTERYWAEHILELREQRAALDEEPLALF